MLGGFPDLPIVVAMFFYDMYPVNFLSVCYNAIKWVHKIHKLYDPELYMIHDAPFLSLNANDLYNNNMESIGISDKLHNVYIF